MKKLLLVLLLVPLVSFGQTYSEEKPALIEKIGSWGEKKAFELYKELTQDVQDKSLNIAEAMFPDPNDWEPALDKQSELQAEYELKFIKKYKKDGMSRNMIIALDGYGTNKDWHKLFKSRY